MRKLVPIFLLLLTQPSMSQYDEEARAILDAYGKRAAQDFPLRVGFEYVYESLIDKETSTRQGTLLLNDEQFRLSIPGSEVYCDGETLWNHLTESNEIYISEPESGAGGDFFITDPTELYTFYKEGFKYRLTREITYQGTEYHEVDLFPENLDQRYHTIKLLIRKKDARLHSAEVFGKQGINHTVVITEYERKAKISPGSFVLDPAEYPEAEIVDTRL